MNTTETIGLLLKQRGENRILSIAPEQSVYQAIEKMAEFNVGALLVISDERLVGILSERDYARKGILAGQASKNTKVYQIMTTPVVYVTPERTVDECMATMTERHFRHLPVMEGESLLGVISIGDLVKWVISGQERKIQDLQSYITGSYPG